MRWYHVYSTIAFMVANLWNFQLNRWWTFKSAQHSRWWREYLPFLAVGLLALIVNLAILTLLMHPGSPFSLSTSFFDDSTGFRTRLYWAPADRDRDRHPAVVRAEQDLDLLRGPWAREAVARGQGIVPTEN